MSSIVHQLQEMASDSQVPIVDLLRKALIVASKLDIGDFERWIKRELDGYKVGDAVPEYRRLTCQMKVHNPFHGLQPFYLTEQSENHFCKIRFSGSISTVYATLDQQDRRIENRGYTDPIIPLSASERNFLISTMEVEMEPIRTIAASSLASLLEAVRSTVLEWSLRLEKEGIIGDGLSFSEKEKELAKTSRNVHISSFNGVLGDVTATDFSQDFSIQIIPGDSSSLVEALAERGVATDDLSELGEAIESDGDIKNGTFGEAVSSWIGKMISKASTGAWKIATPVASSLITSALKEYYGLK